MSPPDLSRRDFSRILLIKPSAAGDVVHVLPVLAALRKRYPRARIDWLLTPENAELVQGHPALSNILFFRRREFARPGRRLAALAAFLRLLREIRHARYDLVIDLHGQLRSALFAVASGAPVRVGFARPVRRTRSTFQGREMENIPSRGWAGAREGSWLAYTHRIPIPTLEVHAVDRYLWVGKLLGFEPGPPEMALPVSPQAEAQAERLLSGHGLEGKPLALLVPGAKWETKQWTVEGFAEVADGLADRGFAVALLGAPAEQPRTGAIRALAPRAADLCGKTGLAEMVALIRRAALVVTNDSGSMHAAAALRKPVVAIFGPTNPVQVGPYGQPGAVVRLGLPCSPCNFRRLSQCPFGHACMRDLPAAMVLSRAEEILGPKGLLAPPEISG